MGYYNSEEQLPQVEWEAKGGGGDAQQCQDCLGAALLGELNMVAERKLVVKQDAEKFDKIGGGDGDVANGEGDQAVMVTVAAW